MALAEVLDGPRKRGPACFSNCSNDAEQSCLNDAPSNPGSRNGGASDPASLSVPGVVKVAMGSGLNDGHR